MAVDRIARRAGVLAGDAAGFRALLQEAGLIDDQHAARVVPEVLDDVVAQIVPHRVGIPGGSVQQALDTFRAALADRLGELPAVLALDAIEQPGEIASGALAHLSTREATGDPLHATRPMSPTTARWCPVQRISAPRPCCPPLAMGEKGSAIHTEVSL